MRKLLGLVAVLVLGLLAYLLLWPVAISPVAWDAPERPGYTGVWAENTALANLERLDMGSHGPEDIEIRDGRIFASSQDGKILTYDLASGAVREFADTGGVPLGLQFSGDTLFVADAHKGLLSVSPRGEVTVLTNEADGVPIVYADDLDIGPDGVVYFSDASTKFGAEAIGSTLAASLYEIMEHGSTGRVLAYDPATRETTVLLDGLSFPNGVAMTADGEAVLVNITGEYNTLRIPVSGGERVGEVTEFAANYPGFPDNINPGPFVDGEPTYILGLVSPRSGQLDAMAKRPFLRKVVWRLPESMRPQAEAYTHIVVLGADGRVLASLQDPSGAYAQATGAIVHGGQLYLSSLTEPAVARRPVPDIYKE